MVPGVCLGLLCSWWTPLPLRGGGGGAIRQVRPAALSARETCESCHADQEATGHPVGVVPARAQVPAGWPLGARGEIGCATCHTRCGRDVAAVAGDPRRASTLRGGHAGLALCSSCHLEQRVRGTGRIVPAAYRRAPLRSGKSRPRAESRQSALNHARYIALAHPDLLPPGPPGVDSTSRRCLYCHDGTVGSSRGLIDATPPGIGVPRASHPIGIAYPLNPRRNVYSPFVPKEQVDGRISLPNGRVGCLSCHDLFSGEDHLLVMSNRESRLCLSCHDL